MALSGFALIAALLLVAGSASKVDTDDEGATLAEHSGATAAPYRAHAALTTERRR